MPFVDDVQGSKVRMKRTRFTDSNGAIWRGNKGIDLAFSADVDGIPAADNFWRSFPLSSKDNKRDIRWIHTAVCRWPNIRMRSGMDGSCYRDGAGS